MKLKILPVILMSLTLGACGSNEPETSSSAPTTSESVPFQWQYLDFLTNKTVRFDLFNLNRELQISYGTFDLTTNISTSAINDNSRLSINKNLESGNNFHMIVVTEKEGVLNGGSIVQVLKNIDCTRLVEFFATAAGDYLVGVDRAYISFTMGENPRWTSGLNTTLDECINAFIG